VSEPAPITPEPEHADAARTADELASHGLLTFLHRDPAAETERRMRSVMRRIADDARGGVGTGRFSFPHARRWAALAACFVIAAGLVYLGLPTGGSAQAMVLASAASLREPGDRRFEVRIQPRGAKELMDAPVGTIDTRGRGAELMVLRLQPEEGVWVSYGRDAGGPWLVFPDGRAERNPPAAALPRFAVVGEQPVVPDSVDRLLEELAHSYTLQRTTVKSADGQSEVEHIVGERRPDRAPGVPRIEAWIDAKTKALKKVELRFPEPPPPPRGMGRAPGGRDGPDGQRGERRMPPPDGHFGGDGFPPPLPPPPEGERDGRGPGRREGPGGPMGRGPRGGPVRIELRPVPPPTFAPDWFSPAAHERRPQRRL